MAGFSNIDADAMKVLRQEIMAALELVTASTGVAFTLGKGKFTSKNGSFTPLSFAIVTDTGEVETKEVTEFKRLARQYNVQVDDLGEGFEYKGKEYILAGLNPKNVKQPFVALGVEDGKRYRFPRHIVVDAMMKQRLNGRRATVTEEPKLDRQYTEAEIDAMTPEERQRLVAEIMAQRMSSGFIPMAGIAGVAIGSAESAIVQALSGPPDPDDDFNREALKMMGYSDEDITEMLGTDEEVDEDEA